MPGAPAQLAGAAVYTIRGHAASVIALSAVAVGLSYTCWQQCHGSASLIRNHPLRVKSQSHGSNNCHLACPGHCPLLASHQRHPLWAGCHPAGRQHKLTLSAVCIAWHKCTVQMQRCLSMGWHPLMQRLPCQAFWSVQSLLVRLSHVVTTTVVPTSWPAIACVVVCHAHNSKCCSVVVHDSVMACGSPIMPCTHCAGYNTCTRCGDMCNAGSSGMVLPALDSNLECLQLP